MVNILDEIKYLRKNKGFEIDVRNMNRYRVVVRESIGYTSYCFSVPIYNAKTKKLVKPKFETQDDIQCFNGSSGNITVYNNKCILEDATGKATLIFEDNSNISVIPTLNGVMCTVHSKIANFILELSNEYDEIRFNDSYLAFMEEKFRPFISISTLCCEDDKGDIFPAELKYSKVCSKEYKVEIFNNNCGGKLFFEVNLYEQKLFQDTTVESNNTEKNNVYGTIGFIGNTTLHGEEWLYSRPDFSKISELYSKRIEKMILHIPVFNKNICDLDIYTPVARFCSFGTTWNNKMDHSEIMTCASVDDRYVNIDVTDIFTDTSERQLIYSEGLVIKKTQENDSFISMSTGDSCFAPQILEIKYR